LRRLGRLSFWRDLCWNAVHARNLFSRPFLAVPRFL